MTDRRVLGATRVTDTQNQLKEWKSILYVRSEVGSGVGRDSGSGPDYASKRSDRTMTDVNGETDPRGMSPEPTLN